MGRLVGIDFGASKSVLCAIEDGRPVLVPSAEGARSTPSVVAFADGGDVLIGETARRQAVTNARRTVRMVKRRLGTAWQTEIGGKVFTAQHISAFILGKLVRDASSYLGEQVTGAVVAVPACFDLAARQAIREAGQIAGLNVARIIGSAEAAALAYLAARRVNATILVFGLGAGAFELSLLAAEEDLVEVKAVSGDNRLGGEEWDQRVVDHLVQQARDVSGADLSEDHTALQRLREAAEQAKIDLSSAAESQISVPYIAQSAGGPVHVHTTLTSTAFQAMTADLLDRCRNPARQIMTGAGDIGHVVLTGGATRMPSVAALARELAGGREPARRASPDEAVAAGAAWLAGTLAGTASSPLLLPVMPWSLGVRTKGGTVARLIERNARVPVRHSVIFNACRGVRTAVSGNGSNAASAAPDTDGLGIGLYQGEHALAADNQLAGVLALTGLPLAPGQRREVEVILDVDGDAVPRIIARDMRTGREQSATITGRPALTADQAEPPPSEIELEVRTYTPSSPQPDNETTDLEPAPLAVQAAREHGLGRLHQSFTVRYAGKPQEIQVFEFEQGLFQQRPGSPPDTFRWDQIATVLYSSTITYFNHVYSSTGVRYTFTTYDGRSAKITSSYRDPARGINPDEPEASGWRRYAALGAAAARHAAAAQLPGAKTALDRGEELTFGKITISTRGVRTGRRDPVPWNQISDLHVADGILSIKQSGESSPFARRPVGKIPNFLLFTTLADMLRKRGPA